MTEFSASTISTTFFSNFCVQEFSGHQTCQDLKTEMNDWKMQVKNNTVGRKVSYIIIQSYPQRRQGYNSVKKKRQPLCKVIHTPRSLGESLRKTTFHRAAWVCRVEGRRGGGTGLSHASSSDTRGILKCVGSIIYLNPTPACACMCAWGLL